MEIITRGSRKRCELSAHASVVDECCKNDTGCGRKIDGKHGHWERSGAKLRTWRALTSNRV